jgi:hypothetical protein
MHSFWADMEPVFVEIGVGHSGMFGSLAIL